MTDTEPTEEVGLVEDSEMDKKCDIKEFEKRAFRDERGIEDEEGIDNWPVLIYRKCNKDTFIHLN
jgi:hypothetical protein